MTPQPDPVLDLGPDHPAPVRHPAARTAAAERMASQRRRPRAGAVAEEPNGDLCSWVAYANDEADLELPAWPEWTSPIRLDDRLPASAEAVTLYRGGEWRRAVGSVNARLAEEARTRSAIEPDLVERAWLTLSQRDRAEQFRRAQWEYRHGYAA